MHVDTTELKPWADVHRILSNMRTLEVKAGGKSHKGPAELSIDEAGHVVLDFGKKGLLGGKK